MSLALRKRARLRTGLEATIPNADRFPSRTWERHFLAFLRSFQKVSRAAPPAVPPALKLHDIETILGAARQKRGMNPDTPSRREMLDHDLQIVRVTLAAISPDVRDFSAPAADAIEEALEKLDSAQEDFGSVDG